MASASDSVTSPVADPVTNPIADPVTNPIADPVVPSFDPNGPDEWDEYDMTEEEEEVYYRQGFDVDEVPGRLMFHQIRPVYLIEDDEDAELMVTLTKHAIDEYNKKEKLKADKGELVYHELLKATQQLLRGYTRNLALNGEIRTYQAVVFDGCRGKARSAIF